MPCTWDFIQNDCVLEVTEQPANRLDQNFNLASLTWVLNGNRGISLRDGDGNAASYTEEQINGFATIALFIAFLEPLRDACAPPTASGSPTAPTAGTGVYSASTPTGAGSTTANLLSLSVTNVGGAAGIWAGASLPAGFSLSLSQEYDAASNEYKRVPAIAYDATGTTFFISEYSA